MALTEFPDPEVAAHRTAAANKAWVRTRLGELAAGFPDHEALADQLALLRRARALAEALLPPEA